MSMVSEINSMEIVAVDEAVVIDSTSFTDKVKYWIANHKTIVAVGGGIIIATGIAIILKKLNVPEATIKEIVEPLKVSNSASNQKEMINIVEEITKRKYTLPTTPFDVSTHIRNLAAGQHASPEKIAQAAMMGIDLGEHQTLVAGYPKYMN